MKNKAALWSGWCLGWFLFGFLMMGGCDDSGPRAVPKQIGTGQVIIPRGWNYGQVRVTEFELNGQKYVVAQGGGNGLAICPVPITKTTTLELTK
jgi:hypothetical protein